MVVIKNEGRVVVMYLKKLEYPAFALRVDGDIRWVLVFP